MELNKIYQGDTRVVLKTMPADYVDCIMTSVPYWGLRDYGVEGQLGLEKTLTEYIDKTLLVTAQLKRVLKPTGVLYWNHGDIYGGNPASGSQSGIGQRGSIKRQPKEGITPKCLALQNYRLIIRMVDDQGWILRNDIKWIKRNHIPSSVKDRFSNGYEPVFMLVKQQKYWFDLDAVRERHKDIPDGLRKIGQNKQKRTTKQDDVHNRVGSYSDPLHTKPLHPAGKNPGDVWDIPTQPFPAAHFATFPEKLCQKPILSSCPQWICRKCGKARERITKATEEYAKNLGKSWHPHLDDKKRGQSRLGLGHNLGVTADYQTIGWTDCKCNAGWDAGVVLEPFAGKGTTCVVAKKLHRNYIGIELKPEYVRMAEKQLINTVVNQELFD